MMVQSTSRRTVLQNLRLQSLGQNTPAIRNEQAPTLQAQKPGEINPAKCVHAGLWLDKYITNVDTKQGGAQEKQEQNRQTLVREVASLEVPALYTTFYNRWLRTLDEAGATSPHYRREFKVKGRMAVGLGNEGVLETSVALHHTYGVPYIPGSALKGLAASYARLMAGEGWLPESPAYKAVFGDTENAGYLTFFDALYVPGSAPPVPATPGDHPLRADIITVHHPNYYKGPNARGEIAAPADWDSPNPVPFLSATGKYLIALAAPDLDEKQGYRESWIEKVFEILTEALLVMGIGAKTSSGYGRMETEPLPSVADEAALQEISDYLNKVQAIPDNQITGQLRNLYYKWVQIKSQAARKVFAEAMIAKARSAEKESDLINQPWYLSLLKYIE